MISDLFSILTVVYTSSSKDLPFNRERLLLPMTFPAESINITKPESALTSCNVVRSDVSTVKDTSLFVEANVENNIKSSNICIFITLE